MLGTLLNVDAACVRSRFSHFSLLEGTAAQISLAITNMSHDRAKLVGRRLVLHLFLATLGIGLLYRARAERRREPTDESLSTAKERLGDTLASFLGLRTRHLGFVHDSCWKSWHRVKSRHRRQIEDMTLPSHTMAPRRLSHRKSRFCTKLLNGKHGRSGTEPEWQRAIVGIWWLSRGP